MADLTRRYVVMAMATEAPFDPGDPDGVFVLKPWKDPAALRALQTYRDNCYPELARGLQAWIRTIEAGPVIRGGVLPSGSEVPVARFASLGVEAEIAFLMKQDLAGPGVAPPRAMLAVEGALPALELVDFR